MQINITGFLQSKNAREFMKELWSLLLSAQENIGGIPSTFLEKKKEEIKQRKVCIRRMFWFRISETSLMYRIQTKHRRTLLHVLLE